MGDLLFIKVPVTLACGCLYFLVVMTLIGLAQGAPWWLWIATSPWWGFGAFLATEILVDVWAHERKALTGGIGGGTRPFR